MNAGTITREARRTPGIDRITVAPALLVLALALLMGVLLPRIDSSAPYRHQVRAGDLAELADGITLVPAPGWNLAAGALVGKARTPVGSRLGTQLVRGGVGFYVRTAPFSGTASALLTRVDEINADLRHAKGRTVATTRRYPVTTHQGAVGVAEDFVGVAREGSIVAFVFAPAAAQRESLPEGVEIVVSGPKAALARRRDDVVAMIRSIRSGS